jgi:single-strand DNA-binding protein
MWLTVVAWRNLSGQVEKVVKKGSLVLVSGRLAVRAYTDKAGTKRTSVEVIAQSIQVLPSKSKTVEVPEQEDLAQAGEEAA